MRKSAKLLNLTAGDAGICFQRNFSEQSADETNFDFLWPNDAPDYMRSDSSMARCNAAVTSPFDFTKDFSVQEQNLARALQRHAKAALRLTKLVGEAEEAAASAERSRIAHDLHDSLTHCLTGVYTQLEASLQLRQRNPEMADSCVHKATDLAHKGLQEVRRLVGALRSDASQYSDLAGNLRILVSESSCEGHTKVRLELVSAIQEVPPDIGYQLYQIAREAVGNSLRYAQAKSIILRLAFSGTAVDLSIADDGVGFRSDQPMALTGYGLNAMRQRAHRIKANFDLRTSPGAGTFIRISACCPAWSRTG